MGERTADVAIIGGGVHGCSIAWHLAKEGVDTVLFERDYLSSGASGRSAAGIRHQFGTTVNCRLSIYNMEKFPVLQDELGYEADLEYDPSGYLWIAYSDTQLCQLEKNVELQNSLGIDSKVLTPEEIQEVAPSPETVFSLLTLTWRSFTGKRHRKPFRGICRNWKDDNC